MFSALPTDRMQASSSVMDRLSRAAKYFLRPRSAWLATVVSVLPSSALADLLRWSTGTVGEGGATALLVDAALVLGWGIAGALIASRTFRWR